MGKRVVFSRINQALLYFKSKLLNNILSSLHIVLNFIAKKMIFKKISFTFVDYVFFT
jgi:hypothetical protein